MPSSIKKSSSNWVRQLAIWLPKQWHQVSWPQWLLLPITIIFYVLVRLRGLFYRWGLIKQVRLAVPVIVVGNITVGGAGKTPLTIALAKKLQSLGLKPGVVSRGYGRSTKEVLPVQASSLASAVGDEPLLIARRLPGCPVYVGVSRVEAGMALLTAHPDCNVIISDDGLQHYRLARDYEIAVVDGQLGLGNRLLLPAGPLREPVRRLDKVDAIVCNQSTQADSLNLLSWQDRVYAMQLAAADIYQLIGPNNQAKAPLFKQQKIVAVAGIGNPQRLFNTLAALGLSFEAIAFADHDVYDSADFDALNADVIIMTEKDAVKCESFADSRYWVLPVDAVLPPALITAIIEKLQQL